MSSEHDFTQEKKKWYTEKKWEKTRVVIWQLCWDALYARCVWEKLLFSFFISLNCRLLPHSLSFRLTLASGVDCIHLSYYMHVQRTHTHRVALLKRVRLCARKTADRNSWCIKWLDMVGILIENSAISTWWMEHTHRLNGSHSVEFEHYVFPIQHISVEHLGIRCVDIWFFFGYFCRLWLV